jgi:hypothetical protein
MEENPFGFSSEMQRLYISMPTRLDPDRPTAFEKIGKNLAEQGSLCSLGLFISQLSAPSVRCPEVFTKFDGILGSCVEKRIKQNPTTCADEMQRLYRNMSTRVHPDYPTPFEEIARNIAQHSSLDSLENFANALRNHPNAFREFNAMIETHNPTAFARSLEKQSTPSGHISNRTYTSRVDLSNFFRNLRM